MCGKDGFEVIKTIQRQKPNVVVADVFMPGLDILGVLNSLKDMNEKELIEKRNDLQTKMEGILNKAKIENREMNVYFIKDPDGYWIEIIPAKQV